MDRQVSRSDGGLSATGLRTKDKRYTPAQVELIVEAIGEPG